MRININTTHIIDVLPKNSLEQNGYIMPMMQEIIVFSVKTAISGHVGYGDFQFLTSWVGSAWQGKQKGLLHCSQDVGFKTIHLLRVIPEIHLLFMVIGARLLTT